MGCTRPTFLWFGIIINGFDPILYFMINIIFKSKTKSYDIGCMCVFVCVSNKHLIYHKNTTGTLIHFLLLLLRCQLIYILWLSSVQFYILSFNGGTNTYIHSHWKCWRELRSLLKGFMNIMKFFVMQKCSKVVCVSGLCVCLVHYLGVKVWSVAKTTRHKNEFYALWKCDQDLHPNLISIIIHKKSLNNYIFGLFFLNVYIICGGVSDHQGMANVYVFIYCIGSYKRTKKFNHKRRHDYYAYTVCCCCCCTNIIYYIDII